MNMCRRLCVLMSTCAQCLHVSLGARHPDWAKAQVPSEQEEEGRRRAWKRWGTAALLAVTTTANPASVCGCGGRSGCRSSVAARQWVSGSDTCSPLPATSSLQLLSSLCLNLFPPFHCCCLLPPFPPPPPFSAGSMVEKLGTAGRGAASRAAPDVPTCEEGGGVLSGHKPQLRQLL